MTIEAIELEDPRLRLPALHNVYPLFNEAHPSGDADGDGGFGAPEAFLDHKYGRVFTRNRIVRRAVYGRTEKMEHYVKLDGLAIVEELRVPYRRIPIFAVSSLQEIMSAIDRLTSANQSHKLLLRGQSRTYMLNRNSADSNLLYGATVNEPSFLPSFLRADFDDLTLQSIWHNQAAVLLHDVGCDYRKTLSESSMQAYADDVAALRRSPDFDGFSLGIAQHYGLPSVGLDLTDDINVAAWFALYTISTDGNGHAACSILPDDAEPTVFVFRCPLETIFDYRYVRPKQFPVGRPDRQSAWFAHVGWGAATNQMGSYLMCGFRLTPQMYDQLPADFSRYLFPSTTDDSILGFFRKMKGLPKHEGECRRALQRIYFFE
ncbi:FRG domain-containing protein [Anatilimnocola sp. NA78]|uniref:FRG domain-containing protein n=1 Tax=Anatilimnocola sp. NA78 TaxID=3415683 RepID=UPI003CE51932